MKIKKNTVKIDFLKIPKFWKKTPEEVFEYLKNKKLLEKEEKRNEKSKQRQRNTKNIS